ncbi:hypothetical protein [Streptomyces sp. NRRL B-24484]|uniref:hypothetical protein n=1 Tax=Streptomyces sp. NRRL B-24484 TaxID=1463833 RepID=UPI0004C22DEF|nr:hypothetical protein [Streptomyces sp. NRRL B-24484]
MTSTSITPAGRGVAATRLAPAAGILMAAAVWGYVGWDALPALTEHGQLSTIEAYGAAAVLLTLAWSAGHQLHVAGRRLLILPTVALTVVLLHIAHHREQGAEFFYGWAPAFGEGTAFVMLGVAMPAFIAGTMWRPDTETKETKA